MIVKCGWVKWVGIYRVGFGGSNWLFIFGCSEVLGICWGFGCGEDKVGEVVGWIRNVGCNVWWCWVLWWEGWI